MCVSSSACYNERTAHLTSLTKQVRNLEERIKVDQLKVALEEIFSEYGNIVEIVAKTNLKAKGQAFIVFDNVESATRAIEEVNGFELFDKPMVLDYAKTKSDATVLREGGTEELEVHKRRRLAEKGAFFLAFSFFPFKSCLLLLVLGCVFH
jgi:RNA recognition motif-containing protein